MSIHATGYFENSTVGTNFTYTYDSSYKVIYSPKTGSSQFKANFTQNYSNPPQTGLIWIQPDGTITAVYESGTNATGSTASDEAGLLTLPFPNIYYYGVDLQGYLGEPGVHELGQANVNLGPTNLSVTNYGISSPTAFCNGSGTIANSDFHLQVGTVPGTTLPLVTVWSQTGTFTPLSGKSALYSSFTEMVTSVTKA